jgi:hypothetical protein
MFSLFCIVLISLLFCLFYFDFIKIFKKITNLKGYNYDKSKDKFSTNANLRYTCHFILSIFNMVLFYLFKI